MEYRPELDGIRAFGIIAVLAFHANVKMSTGGWMAVDTFFVLSGFLITTIAMTEWHKRGRVAMSEFYIRRVARLYPALLLTLVLCLFFFRDIGASRSLAGYLQTAAASGFYYQDFIWGLLGRENGHLGHTWSLAVELQFYLFWPPLLLWLLKKEKPLLPWILGLCAVSYATLVLGSQEITGKAFAPGYYLPWSRAFELLAGCAVAVLLFGKPAPDPAEKPRRRWVGWLIAAGMGFMILDAYSHSILKTPQVILYQAPIITVLTVALMFHLHRVRRHGVGRVLSLRPVAWLGARSYMIYLIHYPVMHVLKTRYPEVDLFGFTYDVKVDGLNMFLTGGAISLVVAAVSWRLVEAPAQQWARRVIARRRAAAHSGETGLTPA